jgi:hypothetical protein
LPVTLQISQPLSVSPVKGFAGSGPVGGPFTSAMQSFALTNLYGGTVNWSLINTSAWLSASATSGSLAAYGAASVTVGLAASATALTAGTYQANVLFSNAAQVVAVAPFTLAVGQPIIQNGGFETGDFTNWTQSGYTSYNYVMSSSSQYGSYVHSGSYAALLGPYGSPGYLTQSLATSAGQNYVLSLWLRNPTGDTPDFFQVQWNGATLFAQTNITFTAWTNLVFLVAATSSATTLQFAFQNDADYFGLDDINVTPLTSVAFKSTVKSAGNFQLVWSTITGIAYQVQYKTNLLQTNWINLGSAITAQTNTLTISDTNALKTSPQRYYRLWAAP